MSHNPTIPEEPGQLDLFKNQMTSEYKDYLRGIFEDNVLKKIRPTASYQRDVVLGHQNLSGSDIRGTARQWGSYYISRKHVARLWIAEGGHIRKSKWTGELTLEVGDIPVDGVYVVGGCSCSSDEVWKY